MSKDENYECIPCKVRSILFEKFDQIFLEMAKLFIQEGEIMDVRYVFHETVVWALEQVANCNASDEDIKEYVNKDVQESFNLIIGQRKIK